MRNLFFCVDGHTAGNPVRLVAGGAPPLHGANMAERRSDFQARFDWIRTSLCFEPRGHDMMSGGFLYPPTRPDTDLGILFIETSGCLPMCGHGMIGLVTFGLECGLIHPQRPGELRIEVPAGIVGVTYMLDGDRVISVRITNVPSYLAARDLQVDVPGLGPLTLDVAYGGNYYAIVEPQGWYGGLDDVSAKQLVGNSRLVRKAVQDIFDPVHPLEPTIRGVSHVMWTDSPSGDGAHARNAVFYGNGAIDRSPCGTGTSARMAQLSARGLLPQGQPFVHESYIGSRFVGTVEAVTKLGQLDAVVPSIEGSAIVTGYNTIIVTSEDPFWKGFQVM